ncbi:MULTISPECIES: Z1 domain-containing protein [unclassified Mesorhizobium]|uniref:Z1 domain-containing protein n=1 Tax=unclassified Mesorhizobium TaxID=325217 RepID=UPI00333A7F06
MEKKTVRIEPLRGATLGVGQLWMPKQAIAATAVLQASPLDAKAAARTLESAAEILGRGVPPGQTVGRDTGLVVGYVQSGKTLSFTTVIGLARDNHFPIVIVVAGTKSSLLHQSTERLERDLNVFASGGSWRKLMNPREDKTQTVHTTIGDWRDAELDEDERATLLITVLKQQDHLAHLTNLLKGEDLKGIQALVVDDEADQAGLNTKVKSGLESTTYRCLRELRDALPYHTYLQYTATPQAPLLINIMSALSPSFVHVLEPGEGYVGGKEFFAAGSKYTEAIPQADIFPANGLPRDPPDSLLDAMRVFFVGLAYTLVMRQPGQTARRSMLIHPSRLRGDHRVICDWARHTTDAWLSTLKLEDKDPDKIALLEDFEKAYLDLKRTERRMPPFTEVAQKLPRALRRTQTIEFNTNGRPTTPEIVWQDMDGWILVGGQAVDRGFTVDSLTVTYMGRGVGTGNADAIQQRARFFGYKKSYLGICRVYLESTTLQAFQSYVAHEEIMRDELKRVAKTGQSLRDWKRNFALSPALKPCRSSVIALGDDYVRGRRNGGWTQQRGALLTQDLREANAKLFQRLVESHTFEHDTSFGGDGSAQQHLVCHSVPVDEVVDFFVDYQLLDARDVAVSTGILMQLGHLSRTRPGTHVSVYRMRPEAISRRTADANGMLEDGFLQGPTGDGRVGYPGDSFFKSGQQVSLQLHRYDIEQKTETGRMQSATSAPLFALHVPAPIALDWIVQSQVGQ